MLGTRHVSVGKPTEDALIEFVINIRVYNNINTDNKSSALFIDFRKAFDTVDYEMSKLLVSKKFV